MDQKSLVQRELDPHEQLLWFGSPLPERVAAQEKSTQTGGIFGAAFIVFWLCVVAFIGFGSGNGGAPAIFKVFTGIMFLFGVAMLIYVLGAAGAPARAAAQAQNTVYAVTDKRLIVLIDGQGARSYGPRDIERVERRDTPDGRGDVIFARERQSSTTHHNGHRRTREWWKDLGFFGIENAREVERLIRTHLVK